MTTQKDAKDTTTPGLVREFAASKVWFAVNETHGRTAEGDNKHRRHCEVVDELRSRGVLD